MALTEAAKNAMLDELGTLITHIGLANVATEVTGGSPAYARKAVTWAAASGGVLAMSGSLTFDIPAAGVVNRALLRSALTAGTDYGNATLTEETFGGQGTYELTALTITLSDP